MTIEELYQYLSRHQPAVIHLTGKTSTGKSTLADRLGATLGYKVISLDKIVRQTIDQLGLGEEGSVFVDIYRTREHPEWATAFVQNAQRQISATLDRDQRVILDGAVANTETLRELLSGLPEPMIAYIHPRNLAAYERNLTSRFMTASPQDKAGLPVQFWKHIEAGSFAAFCRSRQLTPDLVRAIQSYARASQAASSERLASFRTVFNDIVVAYL